MALRILLSSVAIITGSAAIAQDLPNERELISVIASGLPPYWSVDNLEVVATSRGGDAATPEAIVRFEADATPQQDLFAETGKEGPFYLVTRTEEADQVRRLYGFQELTYSAGRWSGTATIENPVSGFGQPLDLFAGPTLEVGTQEARERLAALRDTELEGAISAHEAELSALRAAHETAVAELEAANSVALSELMSSHSRELAELRSANEAALADAETEGQRRVEEARRRYDAEYAELTAEQEPRVAEARAELQTLLAAEREKAQAALANAQEAAAMELEELRAEHAETRGALIEAQRQEMAELETALATERQSLQRQVEMADETITLQQRLLASLDERAGGAEEVLAAFNEAREARRAFFGRLPQRWTGQVSCEAEDLASYSFTGPVSMVLSDGSATTGRVGTIGMTTDYNEWQLDLDISLTMLDDGLTFPLRMRARFSYSRDYDSYFPLNTHSVVDFTVTQDGRMQGMASRPVTIDQVAREVTCTFLLGAVE